MRKEKRWLVLLGAGIGLAIAAIVLVGLFLMGGFSAGVPVLLFAFLLYGWVFTVFVRYRQARQEELLHVIIASVEAKLPIDGALRAYLHDRPNEPLYHFWVGAILHIIVAPYFWLAYELYKFDLSIETLIDEMASGASLSEALQNVPAVASQETRVAAAIGESTGNLADCLRRSARERMTAAWLELIPRFVYPIVLLMFVFGVMTFFMSAVMPKYKKIFEDFKLPLPNETLYMLWGWHFSLSHIGWIALAVVCFMIHIGLLVTSPAFRWYFPIIGRLYSWELRSLALRSLGTMVGMNYPVARALDVLRNVGNWPPPMIERLSVALDKVEAGESLPMALRSARLISASGLPLLRASERTNTLPWALHELGELLSGKALRVARRLSMFFAPLMVVAVGFIVLTVVKGIFVPLISLIEGLSK